MGEGVWVSYLVVYHNVGFPYYEYPPIITQWVDQWKRQEIYHPWSILSGIAHPNGEEYQGKGKGVSNYMMIP